MYGRVLNKDRFLLRHVAGGYWLLDLEMTMKRYEGTLTMNESESIIWDMLCEGAVFEDITEKIYGLSKEGRQKIFFHILCFIEKLKQYGVEIQQGEEV